MKPYKTINTVINRNMLENESTRPKLLKKNTVPMNAIPDDIKILLFNNVPIIETDPPNIGRCQN